MKPSASFALAGLAAAVLLAAAGKARAQVPNTLHHSIPPPMVGLQTGANLGFAVALDGPLAVAGAPADDTGGADAGVVKVFDAATGALLRVLKNPGTSQIGDVLALSGSRVVIGARSDDTGMIDAGRVFLYDLAGAAPETPVLTLDNPAPGAGDQFGSAVVILGTIVAVAASGDESGGISRAGRVFLYDLAGVTPATPFLTLENPAPATDNSFGSALAISGTRIVAGAINDDSSGADAGSVFVYDWAGTTPATPVATLPNPDPGAGDAFGAAVAIAGSRIVVGAYGDDTGAADAGSAYVFDLASPTPAVPVATLPNPTPFTTDLFSDQFGMTVAITGTRVVVGAAGDETNPTFNSGSAYVFDLTAATPSTPVLTISNPSPAANDYFAWAAAMSGTRVVLGATGDDTGAGNAGSAYVYDLAGANPGTPMATLTHPGPASGDSFGIAVAVGGTRVAIGAMGDDAGASNAGSVHVYDLTSATPTQPALTLNNPGPAADDAFGRALAQSGARLVVGTRGDDTGGTDSGSAYIYQLDGSTPATPAFSIANPTPATFDLFGTSVAISGVRVVIGAQGDNTGANDAGSAYVFDVGGATATLALTLNNPGPAVGDYFGAAVAISANRIVVGAQGNDVSGSLDAGSAYVYDLTSATPSVPIRTLNNPTPSQNEIFGAAVAISGNLVIAGVPNDDQLGFNAGIAYVYNLASATPTLPIHILSGAGGRFGSAMRMSGSRVVIGATEVAYVFDLAGPNPTIPITTLNNPAPGRIPENFAAALDIDGLTVAIGVPGDDSTVADKGYAYIFSSRDSDDDGLLDTWEIGHFGTIAGHTALDDFDSDGLNELLELALGGDPRRPDTTPTPRGVLEGGYLTLTLTRRAGAAYAIESAASTAADAFSSSSTTILINDGATLKARDNVPFGAASPRFMRANITAAP